MSEVAIHLVQLQCTLCKQVLGDEVEATGEEGRGAFQPAPRITDADRKNDTKSLLRALDKRLFLLVKAEGGTRSAA